MGVLNSVTEGIGNVMMAIPGCVFFHILSNEAVNKFAVIISTQGMVYFAMFTGRDIIVTDDSKLGEVCNHLFAHSQQLKLVLNSSAE